MTTPTPGAASELLPCPFCGGPAQFTDEGFGFNGVECAAQGCVHMRSPAYVSRERMVAARAWNRRTPSAPVTEGAQREAVAYPDSACEAHTNVRTSEPVCLVCMDNELQRLRNASGIPFGWYCPVGAAFHKGNDRHPGWGKMQIPLYTAPPPPDRVQPEHDASWNRFEDNLVEPTDASGAVTDAMVEAALDAFISPIYDKPLAAYIRRALEAADRARKPVDASAQADMLCDHCQCSVTAHHPTCPETRAQASSAGEPVALTFDSFRAANIARCIKWHPAGIESWSPSDWMTAIVGELGELASLIKMRNRERDGLLGNKFSPSDKQIAEELADVLTYLDLLAAVLGVDLGRAAVAKFNEVSERVGFPDRITLAAPTPVAAYREVTRDEITVMFKHIGKLGGHSYEAMASALRSIGAVIRIPTPDYDAVGAMKQPEPARP